MALLRILEHIAEPDNRASVIRALLTRPKNGLILSLKLLDF